MAQPVTIPFDKLQATIKERLKARGALGIRGIGKAFKIMDDNGNKMLDKYEFSKALSDMGIAVNKMEFSELMRHFDKNGDGNISFDEFLYAIRGVLSDRRKAMVKKAFAVMDKDGSGELTLSDLMGRYDAKNHPKVISGEMTEQQALEELLYAFEGAKMDPNAKGTKDGKVTIEEFEEYYTTISASIDDDDYFVLMMCSAWKISE